MISDLKVRLRKHEGTIPHLYLDTKGFVTGGVGHLFSSPESLDNVPMYRLSDGQLATVEEKRQEWQRVKALEPGEPPSYYAQRTTLRMSFGVIEYLLDLDIDSLGTYLNKAVDDFGLYPETVQVALLDMAFQLGVFGLIHKFPKLMKALKHRDWAECAKECSRQGIQEWRNENTAKLFMDALTIHNDPSNMLDRGIFATNKTLEGLDDLEGKVKL